MRTEEGGKGRQSGRDGGRRKTENGARGEQKEQDRTGQSSRGRLFHILTPLNAGTEEPVPEQPDPAAARPTGLSSATEPPGGGATLLSPWISAPPSWGSPLTPGPCAVPSALSRRPLGVTAVGVGQPAPSPRPEQKGPPGFNSVEHSTLGPWSREVSQGLDHPEPGADQCPTKIPKAVAGATSETVWDLSLCVLAMERRQVSRTVPTRRVLMRVLWVN